MSSETSTSIEVTHRCLRPRCGRKLTSPASIAVGYGPRCMRKIRAAQKAADLAPWTGRQVEQARELFEDGGIVPTSKPGVYRTVATAGDAIYLPTVNGCTCPARAQCYHRCAVVIVTATLTRTEPARVSLARAA